MFICVSDKPHYAMLENIFVYNAVTYCFGCISFKVKSLSDSPQSCQSKSMYLFI